MGVNNRFVSCITVGIIAWALCNSSQAVENHHLMQIQQVIGGVNGDTTAQAIQLRMRAGLQNQVQSGRMWLYDATGQNRINIINFQNSVPNHGTGVTVLIASANFVNYTSPTTVPDFTMTNLIPESHLAAGSLTFENDAGTSIWWRLSWGGANYTGPTTGSATNDADGDFGVYPNVLPSNGVQSLLFQGSASAPSTNNADDYDVSAGPSVWENNAGTEFTVQSALCPDGGILIEGSGQVNDFAATCVSDDFRWGAHGAVFAFQVSDPVCQFELMTTGSTATPGAITVKIEASRQNANANLNVRALLYNFATDTYVAMTGLMPLSTSDGTQTFPLPPSANPTEFVEPTTLEIRLLLQTIQINGPPNVRTQLDAIEFNAN